LKITITERELKFLKVLATGRHFLKDQVNPDRPSVARWGNTQAQADLLVEEMIDLSDDKTGDVLETDIGQQGNNANVTSSRLQVDTRKWIASKLRPKKYGDKVEVENTGEVKVITANFGNPIIPTASQSTENT